MRRSIRSRLHPDSDRYIRPNLRQIERFEPRRLLTVPAAPLFPVDAGGSGQIVGDISFGGETQLYGYQALTDVTIVVTQSDDASGLDSFLQVLDADCNVIAFDDDGGGGLDSQLELSLSAGDFVFLEAGAFGDSTGTYTLTVSTDDFGDSFFDAGFLFLDDEGNGFIPGRLEQDFDVDVFEIFSPLTGSLTIRQQETDFFHDAFLTVRDIFGDVVAQNDDADFTTFDAEVTIDVFAGETFFVEATDLFGFPGTYELIVSGDFGDGDFASTPLDIFGNTRQVFGAIQDFGDIDVFDFVAFDTGTLTIELRETDFFFDGLLTVRNIFGDVIDQNDDFDPFSFDSRIDIDVLPGDFLFIEATDFTGFPGSYVLELSLGAVGGGNEEIPDDYADGFDEATLVTLDETGNALVIGEIGTPFDVDTFRVVPDAGGLLTIEQIGVNGLLDPLVRVLDANGNERFVNDDFGSSLDSRLDVFVDAGEVVIVEAGAFSDSTGLYNLRLSLNTAPGNAASDDFPDTVQDATALPLDAGGSASLTGNIERAFDVDVVSVTVATTGVLTIRQESTDGFLDPFLQVRDNRGNVLAQNDDFEFLLDSRISLPVTAGDTIFIEAGAFFDSVGGYDLIVESGAPIVDDFSNTDAGAQAISLNIDDTVRLTGNIEVFGDRDVVSVQFPAAGTASFAVTAQDEFVLDPLIRIRNAAGEVIAVDDDGGVGLNSLARAAVSANQQLFIDIGTFADASTGAYVLEIILDRGLIITDDFGNTIATATPGSLQNMGSIELPGDVDVFRIDIDAGVPADSTLQIRQIANGQNVFNQTLDPLLTVFDAAGNQIALNDDDGTSLNSELAVQVSGGDTIFVQAGAFGQSSGDYDLRLAFISDDFADTVEQVASSPQLVTTLTGSIERAGDVDVFQLDASITGRVEIRQNGIGPLPADSLLQIFSRTTDTGPLEFVTLNDDSEGTLNSRVLIDIKAGETYFVVAGAFGLTTGDYELQVTSFTADDVGDTFTSGETLVIAGQDEVTRQAEINFVGDVDIFEFTSERDGSATVRVNSNGSGFDGSLAVFRTEGDSFVRITSEEGDGSGDEFSDTFDLTTGTRYFVRINGLGTVGTYEVSVEMSDQPLGADGKIPDAVFDSVDERLRELFASGASFDDLVNGAVDEFLAAMGGNVGNGEFFVFVADPVDFVLADSQNRRVGFTADQGRVNEVGGARLSQNAPVEVLILPTTDRQFPVQLQGVGSNFQIGGRIVTQARAINGTLTTSTGASASGSGTLSKDDGNVALVFDFTDSGQTQNSFPRPLNPGPTAEIARNVATDADTSAFRIAPGDQVATAAAATRAMQDLRDAEDNRLSGQDSARQNLLRWLIESLQKSDQQAMRSLAGPLESLADVLDGDDPDDATNVSGSDVFWSIFGGGVMNRLWDLGEQVIDHTTETDANNEPTDSDSQPTDDQKTQPDATGDDAASSKDGTPDSSTPPPKNSKATEQPRRPAKSTSAAHRTDENPWNPSESAPRLTAQLQARPTWTRRAE